MSKFVEGATTPEETATTVTEMTTEVNAEGVLGELVGEGKKFSDPDKLASAYKHADQRIEELKLELEKSKSVEAILEEIRKPDPVVPLVLPDQGKKADNVNIQELVAAEVANLQSESERKRKVESTWKMMDEAFGDREAASLAVKNYIGEDPAKEAAVNQLALSDPAGLMKLVGKDVDKKPVNFSSDLGSSGDTNVETEGKLTWELAQQVRRKDPKLYYSHAFRARMQEEL